MRQTIFILLFFAALFFACDIKYNTTRQADTVVILDTLYTAPPAPAFEKNINDRVTVITDSGEWYIDCKILDKADTVYLIGSKVGRSNLQEWVKSSDYSYYHSPYSNIQNIITDAYKIRIGEGRLSKIFWLPGKNIYPAPWVRIDTLHKGDSVIIQRFGDFEPYKGVLTQDVQPNSDYIILQYNEYSGSDAFDYDEVFFQTHHAQLADIHPNAMLYFDKMYWVMALGIYDSAHIVVRQSGFPAKDMIVPIGKLEVYQ